MTKKDVIKVKATVVEPHSQETVWVVLDNQHRVLARIDRYKHSARILPGDCVLVEMADKNRGWIVGRC